ncbi:MAG: Lsr2 family protein [Nocardioidaceae bacterium]|nr:Lsr2 family protein [Nocardioidaceae bacterium]
MAQRVHVILEDDVDGSSADETVTFGLDGVTYEIDLSAKNAEKFRESMAKYIGVSRRGGRGAGARRSRRSKSGGPSPSDVRDWARANGFVVSDRGRVSAEVRSAYDAAH